MLVCLGVSAFCGRSIKPALWGFHGNPEKDGRAAMPPAN